MSNDPRIPDIVKLFISEKLLKCLLTDTSIDSFEFEPKDNAEVILKIMYTDNTLLSLSGFYNINDFLKSQYK